MGFTIDESTVHHPKSECRFISFSSNKYLEFIHFPKHSDLYTSPGIAFGSFDSLEQRCKRYEKSGLQCKFNHRNYNWKENNKDILPGWNFLTFKNRKVRTFYPWFITYDPRPKGSKTVRLDEIIHPNGVSEIIGHEFMLNENGFEFVSHLLGTKIQHYITLADGTIFFLKKGNRNAHLSVVLKSKDFEQTRNFVKQKKVEIFNSKEALRIKNLSKNKRMWDLVITS